MQVDIKKFRKDFDKYILSDQELEKIHNFFNQDMFLNILKEKDAYYQKIKWPLFFLIWLLIIGNIVILYYFWFNDDLIWIMVMYSLPIIFIIVYFYFKLQIWENKEKENTKTDEEKVFSEFVDYMFDEANFSIKDEYFDENIEDIKEKTGLLRHYERSEISNTTKYKYLDWEWNHISNITWAEIITKTKTNDGKNKTVVVDHVYLQKINIFSEDQLFDWIKISQKTQFNDYVFSKYSIIGIVVLLIIFQFLIVLIVLIGFFYLFFKFLGWISKSFTSEKTQLEDAEFNKRFDIESKDEVELRNILDSRTITAIKNLAKKFPNKKFDFYIQWNEIYVFIRLDSRFLNLWNYLFMDWTLKNYINFYLMQREVYNIPGYLNLDYHIR